MFTLRSPYTITESQQLAVNELLRNFQNGLKKQVLLGVTGSGKTFAMAHLIRDLNVPALVLSPNKTLAAQLYQEFRGFFPENRVGYFISYYDYYQPEAYVPQRNLYIAKEVSINPELERLRIDATRKVLESRNTVIVASVSSIYSIGSPDDFFNQRLSYSVSTVISRDHLLKEFVSLGYSRTEDLIESGKFRVRGNYVEIFPTSEESPIRFTLEGEKIAAISFFDSLTGQSSPGVADVSIFPINYFFYDHARIENALPRIRAELDEQLQFFLSRDKREYAERLKQKTLFDLEMLEQYGHCQGIENYSYYLSGRSIGEAPFTLLDFFRGDYLTIIDESHITIPQLNGMYEGDRSRKQKLVEYGFRLPTALENRPLNFPEFQRKLDRVLYVSATPSRFEIEDSQRHVTELLVRPTGLIDPPVIIKKTDDPVQDLVRELKNNGTYGRALVTTLTKKMAEKLSEFLTTKGFRCAYLHSEIKSLDRIKIIRKLRTGEIDVLIGINLLREGLDLPEVSLVAILDADKEGFLRSETSLIQTFGRSARNINGKVLAYISGMTQSLSRAIEESRRRREFQKEYNQIHGIEPASIRSVIKTFHDDDYWIRKSEEELKADFPDRETLAREIDRLTGQMKSKAAALDFKNAARIRDHIKDLKNLLIEMY
jgi:excinuclease ABC subunit B